VTATTAVLAGGLGSRVASLTGPDLPKALLDLNGRPFLDWKLDELAREGVRDVLVLAGHGGDQIARHLADLPHPSVRVSLLLDGGTPLGTGGAVAAALPHLPDLFWVTYGDTLLDVRMADLEGDLTKGDDGLLVVVRNEDRIQPSNTTIEGRHVVGYAKGSPPGTHAHLDYGLVLLRRGAFAGFSAMAGPFDLGEVLHRLIEAKRLAAVEVEAAFYDIGTPEAWRATREHYSPG